MSYNRRNSLIFRFGLAVFATVWPLRWLLLLSIPYGLLLLWLFQPGTVTDLSPSRLLEVTEDPVWKAPDENHWFGTTSHGSDLFELSRMAIGTSVAWGITTASLGLAAALFFAVILAMLDGGQKASWVAMVERGWRGWRLIPAMAVLIVVGGSGGNLGVTLLTVAALVALALTPVLREWIHEKATEEQFLMGLAVGLTPFQFLYNRVLPDLGARLLGVLAGLIPALTLAEMALASTGLSGDRPSAGVLIAAGTRFLSEAPWLAVGPGALATAVVVVLSALGGVVQSRVAKDRLGGAGLPRIL